MTNFKTTDEIKIEGIEMEKVDQYKYRTNNHNGRPHRK